MLVRMSRLQDVDGLPKVQPKTPQEFFSDVEKEDCGNLCRWRGELYLELHNGTYTTHAKVEISVFHHYYLLINLALQANQSMMEIIRWCLINKNYFSAQFHWL